MSRMLTEASLSRDVSLSILVPKINVFKSPPGYHFAPY